MPHLSPWGWGGVGLLVLYSIQAEIRFGERARKSATEATDRGSTLAVSLASAVPAAGFAMAMVLSRPEIVAQSPPWTRHFGLPWMPAFAWAGVALGGLGLLLRMWAVLTLRERYTRTLLIQDAHAVERGGPYRFVRHPGYLGSLLCLNGIGLASGNLIVAVASIAATFAAYAYRIRVEDAMLIRQFGETYERYRREVPALLPFAR